MSPLSVMDLGSPEELRAQLHWERYGFDSRFGSPSVNYSRRPAAPIWLPSSQGRVVGTGAGQTEPTEGIGE